MATFKLISSLKVIFLKNSIESILEAKKLSMFNVIINLINKMIIILEKLLIILKLNFSFDANEHT